jgi:hypothetical protein
MVKKKAKINSPTFSQNFLAILAFILTFPLTFTHALFFNFSDDRILFFQRTKEYIKSIHGMYQPTPSLSVCFPVPVVSTCILLLK